MHLIPLGLQSVLRGFLRDEGGIYTYYSYRKSIHTGSLFGLGEYLKNHPHTIQFVFHSLPWALYYMVFPFSLQSIRGICIAMITLLMILLTTILSFLLQEMPKPSVMITPHALEDSCRCVLIPSSRSKAASSRIIYWSNPGLLHNHHKRETTMYSISSQLQLRFVSKCIRRQLSGEGMRDPPP